MKPLLFILIYTSVCYSQKHKENFITYSNYSNEAEYYFHEGIYDTAAIYFEEAFKYSKEQHPTHQKLFAYSLIRTNERKKAINILNQMWSYRNIDTIWFSDLTIKERNKINKSRLKIKNAHTGIKYYRHFLHELDSLDQLVRLNWTEADWNISERVAELNERDSINQVLLIKFIKKHGFPGGKNAGWDQSCATALLHFSPEWFAENYALLISEVQKGNLEPWILARGIDRKYAIEINEEKINPYNRYWTKSAINPFLMFQNCIAIGVSPYYHYNWFRKPKKTIHFEYYKKNKKYYNTTVMYTHNIGYTPLPKSRSE